MKATSIKYNPLSTETLISVKEAARQTNYQEMTITKWIRDNKLPGRKVGKRWYIQTSHWLLFLENGKKMPPDFGPIDNSHKVDVLDDQHGEIEDVPIENIRPIQTFSELESGRSGWAPSRAPKIPNELVPRIDRVIKILPQYNNSYGNFYRDAIYSRLLDIEQVLKQAGQGFDPAWESYRISQIIIERDDADKRTIESLKKAVSILKNIRDPEEWKSFIEKQRPHIMKMSKRYRRMARTIIMAGKSGMDLEDREVFA